MPSASGARAGRASRRVRGLRNPCPFRADLHAPAHFGKVVCAFQRDSRVATSEVRAQDERMTYRIALLVMTLAVGCGDDADPVDPPVDITRGSWDPSFSIAGVGGHDGVPPTVFDFATDVDGSVLAAGRFEWFGG